MKQAEGVLWIVEVRSEMGGTYTPLLNKVCGSRRTAKQVKEQTKERCPAGTKFRVAKYVRQGGGQ